VRRSMERCSVVELTTRRGCNDSRFVGVEKEGPEVDEPVTTPKRTFKRCLET